LHHTGIKTYSLFAHTVHTCYFNCTIQELKQGWYDGNTGEIFNFNCTIQELKQERAKLAEKLREFQLHHTGIKTRPAVHPLHRRSRFQLHHTGIKTAYGKLHIGKHFLFQLHHTGIKTQATDKQLTTNKKFQLHHTGIKTLQRRSIKVPRRQISIAPYRN